LPDKPWKAFEREAAKLIGGKRYWSNSGEKYDIESELFLGQCKHVQRLSLTEMESLAHDAQENAGSRIGIVVVKRRAGKGRNTHALVILDERAFRLLLARCARSNSSTK